MKVLIVHDSLYGNTAKVAQAIARGFPKPSAANALAVTDVKDTDLEGAQILVAGSPTHGGRPSQPMQTWLDSLADGVLAGKRFATFDTRFRMGDQKPFLRILMRVIGYAAPRIAAQLTKKGGMPVAPPEGFIVTGREGPLDRGELKRAGSWAGTIARQVDGRRDPVYGNANH